MANEDNERAPWTVKGMDVATRKRAVACANKRGVSMAVWLANAVDNQANLEAGDQIIMPGQPRQTTQQNGQTRIDMGELSELIREVRATAEAAGVPIPKPAARHALALMQVQLRAARGLPPLAQRQTRPRNGQTIDIEATAEMLTAP